MLIVQITSCPTMIVPNVCWQYRLHPCVDITNHNCCFVCWWSKAKPSSCVESIMQWEWLSALQWGIWQLVALQWGIWQLVALQWGIWQLVALQWGIWQLVALQWGIWLGGFAVGYLTVGGFAVGYLTVGGSAVGYLTVGGFAVGYLTVGGFAVGYVTVGGFAVRYLTDALHNWNLLFSMLMTRRPCYLQMRAVSFSQCCTLTTVCHLNSPCSVQMKLHQQMNLSNLKRNWLQLLGVGLVVWVVFISVMALVCCYTEKNGGGGAACVRGSVCEGQRAWGAAYSNGCCVCAAWRAATWRCCTTPSQTSTSCTCMRAAFSPSSLPTAASGSSPPARTISSTPGELPMVPAFSRSVSLFLTSQLSHVIVIPTFIQTLDRQTA